MTAPLSRAPLPLAGRSPGAVWRWEYWSEQGSEGEGTKQVRGPLYTRWWRTGREGGPCPLPWRVHPRRAPPRRGAGARIERLQRQRRSQGVQRAGEDTETGTDDTSSSKELRPEGRASRSPEPSSRTFVVAASRHDCRMRNASTKLGSEAATEGEVEECRLSVSPMEAPAEVIDGCCGKVVRREHRRKLANQDLGLASDLHHEENPSAARRCCICPQTIAAAACSCGRVNTKRARSLGLDWQRGAAMAGW